MQDVLNSLSSLGVSDRGLPNTFVSCARCFSMRGISEVLPCSHAVCKKCLDDMGHQCHLCLRDSLECLPTGLVISSILSMVKDDGYAATSKLICSNCNEQNPARGTCEDCGNELLCDNCINAHQRVRLTREHAITLLDGGRLKQLSSPLVSPTDAPKLEFSSNSSKRNCDAHPAESYVLFCESCSQPLCRECTLKCHAGHSFIYLQDALEKGKEFAQKAIVEAEDKLKAIREMKGSMHLMTKRIEKQSAIISTEIKRVLRRQIALLEEREKALLNRVEHVRTLKTSHIRTQTQLLETASGQLSAIIKNAKAMLENDNDMEFLKAKQTLCVAAINAPCEEVFENDKFAFIPPDRALVAALSCAGTLSTDAYAPNCVAFGDSTRSALVGRTAKFLVQARDHVGELVALKDSEFVAKLIQPDGTFLDVELSSPSNSTLMVININHVGFNKMVPLQ